MNVRLIAGKAMFTIVTSRNTMNAASDEISRTLHSRGNPRRRRSALTSTLGRETLGASWAFIEAPGFRWSMRPSYV
jgi:hypothetical protein